jgi:hypothetical protein
MITVIIEHKVKDFATWKAVFDAGFDFRHRAGEESHKLFRNINQPSDVTVVSEFPSVEAAQKFLNSEWLKTRMQEAGVVGEPKCQLLAEVFIARRTSAD